MSCLAAFPFSRGAKMPLGHRESPCKFAVFCGAKEQVSEKCVAFEKRGFSL
jgi:hypothetical protein